MLKKNNLTYKGRIDTDLCKVVWLKDGEGEFSARLPASRADVRGRFQANSFELVQGET